MLAEAVVVQMEEVKVLLEQVVVEQAAVLEPLILAAVEDQ